MQTQQAKPATAISEKGTDSVWVAFFAEAFRLADLATERENANKTEAQEAEQKTAGSATSE